MEPKDDRDALFAVIRELETLHTNCVNKAKFIDNVMSGKEQITFATIDRCREALMQLNQAHHVFKSLYEKHSSTAEVQDRMKAICDTNRTTVDKANADLKAILAWVPPGPMSRRTDN